MTRKAIQGYLTLRPNGRRLLTKERPVCACVGDTDSLDAYARPGDPLALNGIKPTAAELLWGVTEQEPLRRGVLRVEFIGGLGWNDDISNEVQAWLTKAADGLFWFTASRPDILGSQIHADGDLIEFRDLCPWSAQAVWGVNDLPALEPTPAWWVGYTT